MLRRPVESGQYTSWLFGTRLRAAGLLGSTGEVACAYDNSLMESFFGSMQIELLDRRTWPTRACLATAIFEWIEAFYNPLRRHSALAYLSPLQFGALHTARRTRHDHRTETVRETGDSSSDGVGRLGIETQNPRIKSGQSDGCTLGWD